MIKSIPTALLALTLTACGSDGGPVDDCSGPINDMMDTYGNVPERDGDASTGDGNYYTAFIYGPPTNRIFEYEWGRDFSGCSIDINEWKV